MKKVINFLKMKKTLKVLGLGILLIISSILIIPKLISAQQSDLTVKIHIQGVYKSKISIIPLAGARHTPLGVIVAAKEDKPSTFLIPERHLPGEFLLRFEYHETPNSQRPATSEKMILLYKDDTELWVNPKFPNNPKFSYFHDDDKENKVFMEFMQKNNKSLDMLNLLQNFLLNYDKPESEFYQAGIKEFNSRRNEHNDYIKMMQKENKGLFVASLFSLYYVPEVNWSGTEKERQQSLAYNYFDGINFDNKLILRSSSLRTWMDNYVNIFSDMIENPAMTDSIFTRAGYLAIEKAKKGHPEVYGWMVDYFFNGYESLDIQMGIEMLAPYIADPNCKTGRRKEIERRLTGIQSLTKGTMAPDFRITDNSGKTINFSNFKTSAKYKLVLFWSADCGHCVDMARQLHRWHINNREIMEIFAISLDETETEIPKWEKIKPDLTGWIHTRAHGGVNSPEANSYYILSTPTMFLVDAKTNKIISAPSNLNQLLSEIK